MEKMPLLLTRQHEEEEGMVEVLQSEQRQLADTRYDNHELQGKIVNLIKQLHANERRLSESAREIQKIGHRKSKLQTEVANLKQQLKASYTTIQKFETKEKQLLNQLQTTESILAATLSQHREIVDRDSRSELAQTRSHIDQLMIRNEELLAEIDSLSNELAASQQPIEELQTPQNGTKSKDQQLRIANQELQTEIATLKEQLQTSENRFSELARQNQQRAESHARLPAALTKLTPRAHERTNEISQLQRENLALREVKENQSSALGQQIDKGPKKEAARAPLRSSGERNPRSRMIPAAATIIVTAIAIGLVSTSSDKDADHTPQKPSPSVAESRMIILETSTEPSIAEAVGETGSRITEVPKQTPAGSPPRLNGTFKTTRPVELFNAPSEKSALIRTLAAGIKINVVNSRDGWLEVRSKHGTSGFVRQEGAVKIGEDQS